MGGMLCLGLSLLLGNRYTTITRHKFKSESYVYPTISSRTKLWSRCAVAILVKRVQPPQQTKTRKTVTFPKTVTRNQAFQKTVTLIVTVTKFLFKTVTFP